MHTSPSTQPTHLKRTWTKPTLTTISLGDARASKTFPNSPETTLYYVNGHAQGVGPNS
jgi:hypothetical protein